MLLAFFCGLQPCGFPLLFNPITATRSQFVSARKTGADVRLADHPLHEGCLADLLRTEDRLNKAPSLT